MKIQTISPKSEDIYWELSEIGNLCHASCTHNGYKISGSGLGYKYEIAKKIAFSELNERHLVLQLQKLNSEVNKWGLNIDNSCSGFAIGYSRESTVLRSALEGVERWALSQWVDEGYCLQKIDDPEFTTADFKSVVNSCFNSISIYHAVIPLFLFNKVLNINVCSLLCWTEFGVFVGYGSKPIKFRNKLLSF